jgi:phospholipase/carboxylesterase
MLVLHGRGDSYKPFLQLPEEMNLPEMNYLFLNAPRKYDGGYSWYGMEPNHEKGILRSRSKLHHLMEELDLQGWQSENIFMFGLSQGCLMASDLVMTYDRPFAGLLGISGYVWFFPKWSAKVSGSAKRTPWIMTHGLEDMDIPIEETRSQVKRLQKNGFSVEWLEMNKGHEVETQFEAPMLGGWVRNQVEKRLAYEARHHRRRQRLATGGLNPLVDL